MNADVVAAPFAKPEVPVHVLPAADAVLAVAQNAGDSLCRDSVDRDLVAQLLSFGKRGKLIADETELAPGPSEVEAKAPKDSDGDGIPDAWELAHHINPHDALDGQRIDAGTGYSNLEIYINELANKMPSASLASPNSCR